MGLSRLSAWWLALGIDLERGRPGCPQDNGAHERMHRDIRQELQAGRIGRDQAAFEVWRQEFNTERPHEALAMACPAERYEPSGRRYEGTPAELDYGDRDTRKVHARTGTIWYEGRQLLITSALGGWNVGLGASVDGLVELWFANLLLGHVDPAVVAFIKIQPPAPGEPLAPPADSATLHRPPGPRAEKTSSDQSQTCNP